MLSWAKAGQAMSPTGNRSDSWSGSDGHINGNHRCRGLGGGVATEQELGGDSSLLFLVVSTEVSRSTPASWSDDLRSMLSWAKAGQAMSPTGNRSDSWSGSDGHINGNHRCRGLGGGVATEQELGGDSSLLFLVVSTEVSRSTPASWSDDLRSMLSWAKAGQAMSPTGNRSDSWSGSDGHINGNHRCRGLGGGVATEQELGGDSSLLFLVVSTEVSRSTPASWSDDLRSMLSWAKAGQAMSPTGNRSDSWSGSDGELGGDSSSFSSSPLSFTPRSSSPLSSLLSSPFSFTPRSSSCFIRETIQWVDDEQGCVWILTINTLLGCIRLCTVTRGSDNSAINSVLWNVAVG